MEEHQSRWRENDNLRDCTTLSTCIQQWPQDVATSDGGWSLRRVRVFRFVYLTLVRIVVANTKWNRVTVNCVLGFVLVAMARRSGCASA